MNNKQYKQRLQKIEVLAEVNTAQNRLYRAIKMRKSAIEVHQKAQGDWKIVTVDNVLYWERLYREAKEFLRQALKRFHKIIHS